MNDFEIEPAIMPDAQTDMSIYLNELFTAKTATFQKLTYELQREFRFSGSPDIRRIHIDRIDFDATKGTGRFRIVLDIDFTFGCEDVLASRRNQTSEWTFETDTVNDKLLFYGSPYSLERSTADDF